MCKLTQERDSNAERRVSSPSRTAALSLVVDNNQSCNTKEWHNPQIDKPMREEMIRNVFRLLVERYPDRREGSVLAIAQSFEQYIYHNAESLEKYSNKTTLRQRLYDYALSQRNRNTVCQSCGGPTVPSGGSASSTHCLAGLMCPSTHRESSTLLREQQRRILLLKHIWSCTKSTCVCEIRDCGAMKEKWQHITNCQLSTCPIQHCLSTRTILKHFTRCLSDTCTLCGPVKRAIKRSSLNNNTMGVTSATDMNCPVIRSTYSSSLPYAVRKRPRQLALQPVSTDLIIKKRRKKVGSGAYEGQRKPSALTARSQWRSRLPEINLLAYRLSLIGYILDSGNDHYPEDGTNEKD